MTKPTSLADSTTEPDEKRDSTSGLNIVQDSSWIEGSHDEAREEPTAQAREFGDLPVATDTDNIDAGCSLVRHNEKPTASRVAGRLRAEVRAAGIFGTSRRYGPNWALNWWASVLGREEGTRSWASTTALITLVGMRKFPIGRQVTLLTESSGARHKALSRALSGVTRYESLTVVGAYQTGHAHLHIGLWIAEPVSETDLRPVVESHVNNCPIACEQEHGARAVFVQPAEADSSRGLVSYLGGNVPGMNCRGARTPGLLDEGTHRQLLAGTLEALNMRPIRPGWSDRADARL